MNRDGKTIREAARLFVQYRIGHRRDPEAWVASHLFLDSSYLPSGASPEAKAAGRALARRLTEEFQLLLSDPERWLSAPAESALPKPTARTLLNKLRRLLVTLPADDSRNRIRVPVTIELATDRLVLADRTLLQKELEQLLQKVVVPALEQAVQQHQAPYIKTLCGSVSPPIRFAMASPPARGREVRHEEETRIRSAIHTRFRRRRYNLTYTEDEGWLLTIPGFHRGGMDQDFTAEIRPGGLVVFNQV